MLALVLALSATPAVFGATYPLVESWSGQSFLDGWKADPSTYDNTTNGDVFWAGLPTDRTPNEASLYYTKEGGTTILKVDNTNRVLYNQKRYAPKLLSKTAYPVGTVWVLDAVHMPYGCSVWPAFWTQGPNWPSGGEIDIVEGVNLQQGNQVALHGTAGCTATPMGETIGNLTQANCQGGNGAGGCTYRDPNANSFGAGFAEGGGGVFVTELAEEGIRVWFMPLGTPVASYSSSSCDIASLFGPQTMTLTITLCGDWAGNVLPETCPPLSGANATCYSTYVGGEAGDKYDNAYFEINYVNVYSTSPPSTATNPGSNASVSSNPSASGASGSPAQSSTAASGKRAEWTGLGWIIGIAAGVLAGGVVAIS